MTSPNFDLGELERVPLRAVWSDEAANFTPWLACAENLRRLGDALGIELVYEDEEVSVGSYAADILCKNTADGSWVVIENQIERTDHRHLGQILTYAAGLGARTMVWIAAQFTDEHRAALDWLNDNTGEDIAFFGLEIEVWRIGDSAVAPKFNLACKPNDWSKAVRTQAATAAEGVVTPHKQLQFEFWTAFKNYLEEHSRIRPQTPRRQHWLIVTIGRAGFHLAAITSKWNTVSNRFDVPEVRVELTMNSRDAKAHFLQLEAKKAAIEPEMDLPLLWHNPEEANACKISVRRDGNFLDREQWPELFEWLRRYLEKFDSVFRPIVAEL